MREVSESSVVDAADLLDRTESTEMDRESLSYVGVVAVEEAEGGSKSLDSTTMLILIVAGNLLEAMGRAVRSTGGDRSAGVREGRRDGGESWVGYRNEPEILFLSDGGVLFVGEAVARECWRTSKGRIWPSEGREGIGGVVTIVESFVSGFAITSTSSRDVTISTLDSPPVDPPPSDSVLPLRNHGNGDSFLARLPPFPPFPPFDDPSDSVLSPGGDAVPFPREI